MHAQQLIAESAVQWQGAIRMEDFDFKQLYRLPHLPKQPVSTVRRGKHAPEGGAYVIANSTLFSNRNWCPQPDYKVPGLLVTLLFNHAQRPVVAIQGDNSGWVKRRLIGWHEFRIDVLQVVGSSIPNPLTYQEGNIAFIILNFDFYMLRTIMN